MIITLTQHRKDTDWLGEHHGKKVLLCPNGMKLMRVHGDMLNLELSPFAQKGMIQVNLGRQSPSGIWRWELPTRPILMKKMRHEIGSLCFGFDELVIDAILTELFQQENVENLLDCSIWIKFTLIPKWQNPA